MPEAPWDTVFELMWEAYDAGTIPVGAVVTDESGTIVARGRNRIFDEPAEGQLGRSRLAHAEINALAALPSDRTYRYFSENDPQLVADARELPARAAARR